MRLEMTGPHAYSTPLSMNTKADSPIMTQQTIRELWHQVYDQKHNDALEKLMRTLDAQKATLASQPQENNPDWYRDAVVYSLYVDAYAGDFDGLTDKLDYIQDLGVNTLWLLPILDSPMRDQGFDIRSFRNIRSDLGGNDAFRRFIAAAHQRGIRLLFDMAVNHSSDQHPWFIDAASSKTSPYRDYYIWSTDTTRYSDARLLFKGMVDSNWEYNAQTDDYYFHRFYAFQPDLNYRNPALLIDMIDNFLFWQEQGVDGLRMDAIPFIWKEEGTNCEDLPQVHSLLKLIRASLDYCRPGTLMIAEANMAPKQVVSYFGDDDECQAAYHFPLMPQLYMAVAEADYRHIEEALAPEVTPAIPEKSCWMSFLRCHDELTLEFVTPEVRDRMNEYYLHDPLCRFREGEGIAGRLFYLLREDPDKVLLMHSMLFATEGSPILYYGDEVGMGNDVGFYEQTSEQTGFQDARFLNRGSMDWRKVQRALKEPESVEHRIHHGLRSLIALRREYSAWFYHSARIIRSDNHALYGLSREHNGQVLQIYHNLGDQACTVHMDAPMHDLVSGAGTGRQITLSPSSYCWLIADRQAAA